MCSKWYYSLVIGDVMKVVAFNGSPRHDGNCSILIRKFFEPLEEAGIKTELVQIGGKPVRGCSACMACRSTSPGKCVFDDDFINDAAQKCREADGLVLASPTYYANVSTETKAFIDRVGFVLGPEGALKRKPAAAIVSVRRAGAISVFDAINHFFAINGMFIVGGTYWNMGIGLEKGECLNDEEGLRNMLALGENFTWFLQKIVAE